MKEELSTFELDAMWMSYRYCIGRNTIAAHMHAGEIANHFYDKLNTEKMAFNAYDICREIYDRLHFHNFINIESIFNIPEPKFKPLDILYDIFSKENISSLEKLNEIKTIEIWWNTKDAEFEYTIYYYKDYDKNKHCYTSIYDITSLEVWQRLANLFDKSTHKRCKLIDDSIIEYYEYWRHTHNQEGEYVYKKVKTPIDGYHNFSVCRYIPEESIKEDNI